MMMIRPAWLVFRPRANWPDPQLPADRTALVRPCMKERTPCPSSDGEPQTFGTRRGWHAPPVPCAAQAADVAVTEGGALAATRAPGRPPGGAGPSAGHHAGVLRKDLTDGETSELALRYIHHGINPDL